LSESFVTRVVSRDGTEIAYWTSGDGPPLVLVHGAPADHTRWRPLLPYLESHATVHARDRRGRGASGDAPDYHLARAFEDVAAVVDAVAEASGSAVDVYGHSFGGVCAFGGATLISSIRRLVLYEGWPPVNPDAWALPPGIGPRVDALLADGDGEAVAEMVFRELVMMRQEELGALRAQPEHTRGHRALEPNGLVSADPAEFPRSPARLPRRRASRSCRRRCPFHAPQRA
jgi:pimeloyl-ACP methyl ester carboxylesterase